MDAKLVLVRKGLKPTVVRLKKLPMTVGRGREADLTIAHPMVSRLHCELYEVDGSLCIRDMGSLNGTFVGESQITEASLESGDELIVGSAKFQVVIDEEVDAGKEIEAPTVTADDETDDQGGSFIDATEFDDLQEGEFEEIEEEEEEEFDEALAETDEGVEQPPAEADVEYEDQIDDDVIDDVIIVTEDDDEIITAEDDDEIIVTEDDDEIIVTEDDDEIITAEDDDEIIAAESVAADEEPTEAAPQPAASEPTESPTAEDQPAAAQEKESASPPKAAEKGEPAKEAAASSGKIDLGITADEAPAKVESDDDDLTDFLAGLN